MLASAIISAGIAGYNAVSSKRAKNAADRTLGALNAENASNYYSDYYRGALENDSTRAYLKRLDQAMNRQNRTLDNSIVSTGATNENALAQRQAKNEVMSGAMGQAVAAEDARKQGLKDRYFQNKKNLTINQMNMDQQYRAQQQQNLAQLAEGISQAAGAYAMYGDWDTNKPKSSGGRGPGSESNSGRGGGASHSGSGYGGPKRPSGGHFGKVGLN